MELRVVAVGKLRSFYREACDEYASRLRRYVKFQEIEARDDARLEAKLADGAVLVALTRRGVAWSSAELAGEVDRWLIGARPIEVVIGGPQGLAPHLLKQAGARWSLGPLTLPHELARVVVLEQLYRAFTILRGEPYHKGAPDAS
jgi:23S rRNA (pseudouridine1915-N3)-methyltransferase